MPVWQSLLPFLGTVLYLALLAAAGRPGKIVAVALLGGLASAAAWGLARVFGGAWAGWPGFAHVWLSAPPNWLGVVEEGVKGGAVLAARAWVRRDPQTGLDGAVYGLAVGVGYALVGHLAVFLQGAGPPAAFGVGLHVLGAGLAHAMLPALYGALLEVAEAWNLRPMLRWALLVGGWSVGAAGSVAFAELVRISKTPGPWQPVAAAGLLLWEWAPVGLVALVHVRTRRRERELLIRFLREEVGTDVVTEDEFLALLADARGFPKPLRVALVRLVWAKWRVVRGLAQEAEVEAWREQVRRLRRTG